MRRILLCAWVALAASAALAPSAPAAVRSRTAAPAQPVHVSVTCVTNHSGSFDASFGYQNDNAVAVNVPIGNENFFAPGLPNRGQPTTFQPGVHQSAFTITGIANGTTLTWT